MIKTTNIQNLFWTNGSFKKPARIPSHESFKGVFPDIEPTLETDYAGWVVLEGDWNYCWFENRYYFLEQLSLIDRETRTQKYSMTLDFWATVCQKGIKVTGLINKTTNQILLNQYIDSTSPLITSPTKRSVIPMTSSDPETRRTEIIRPKDYEPFYKYPLLSKDFFDLSARSIEEIKKKDISGAVRNIIWWSIPLWWTVKETWETDVLKILNHTLDEIQASGDLSGSGGGNYWITTTDQITGLPSGAIWAQVASADRVAISTRAQGTGSTASQRKVPTIDLSGLKKIKPLNINSTTTLDDLVISQMKMPTPASVPIPAGAPTAPFRLEITRRVYLPLMRQHEFISYDFDKEAKENRRTNYKGGTPQTIGFKDGSSFRTWFVNHQNIAIVGSLQPIAGGGQYVHFKTSYNGYDYWMPWNSYTNILFPTGFLMGMPNMFIKKLSEEKDGETIEYENPFRFYSWNYQDNRKEQFGGWENIKIRKITTEGAKNYQGIPIITGIDKEKWLAFKEKWMNKLYQDWGSSFVDKAIPEDLKLFVAMYRNNILPIIMPSNGARYSYYWLHPDTVKHYGFHKNEFEGMELSGDGAYSYAMTNAPYWNNKEVTPPTKKESIYKGGNQNQMKSWYSELNAELNDVFLTDFYEGFGEINEGDWYLFDNTHQIIKKPDKVNAPAKYTEKAIASDEMFEENLQTLHFDALFNTQGDTLQSRMKFLCFVSNNHFTKPEFEFRIIDGLKIPISFDREDSFVRDVDGETNMEITALRFIDLKDFFSEHTKKFRDLETELVVASHLPYLNELPHKIDATGDHLQLYVYSPDVKQGTHLFDLEGTDWYFYIVNGTGHLISKTLAVSEPAKDTTFHIVDKPNGSIFKMINTRFFLHMFHKTYELKTKRLANNLHIGIQPITFEKEHTSFDNQLLRIEGERDSVYEILEIPQSQSFTPELTINNLTYQNVMIENNRMSQDFAFKRQELRLQQEREDNLRDDKRWEMGSNIVRNIVSAVTKIGGGVIASIPTGGLSKGLIASGVGDLIGTGISGGRSWYQFTRDEKLALHERALKNFHMDLKESRLAIDNKRKLNELSAMHSNPYASTRAVINKVAELQGSNPRYPVYLTSFSPSDIQQREINKHYFEWGVDCTIPDQTLTLSLHNQTNIYQFQTIDNITEEDLTIRFWLENLLTMTGVKILDADHRAQYIPLDFEPIPTELINTLTNKIQRLEEVLENEEKERRDDIRKLTKEKNELEILLAKCREVPKPDPEKISELETKITDLEGEAAMWKEQWRNMKDDWKTVDQQLTACKKEKQQLQDKIAELNTGVTAANLKVVRLEEEKRKIEESLEGCRKLPKRDFDKEHELEKQLRDKTQEIQQLKADREHMEEEWKETKDNLRKSIKDLTDAKANLKLADQRLRDTAEKAHQLEQQLEGLRKDLQDCRDRPMGDYEKELELTNRIKVLEEEITAKDELLQETTTQRANLERELQTTKTTLTENLNVANNRYSQIFGQLTNEKEENKKLIAKKEELEESVLTQTQRILDLTTKKEELDGKLLEANAELSKAKKQLEECGTGTITQEEYDKCETKRKELETDIMVLKSEKTKIEGVYEYQKKEIERLKGQISNLNTQITQKDKKIKELEKKIKDLEKTPSTSDYILKSVCDGRIAVKDAAILEANRQLRRANDALDTYRAAVAERDRLLTGQKNLTALYKQEADKFKKDLETCKTTLPKFLTSEQYETHFKNVPGSEWVKEFNYENKWRLTNQDFKNYGLVIGALFYLQQRPQSTEEERTKYRSLFRVMIEEIHTNREKILIDVGANIIGTDWQKISQAALDYLRAKSGAIMQYLRVTWNLQKTGKKTNDIKRSINRLQPNVEDYNSSGTKEDFLMAGASASNLFNMISVVGADDTKKLDPWNSYAAKIEAMIPIHGNQEII